MQYAIYSYFYIFRKQLLKSMLSITNGSQHNIRLSTEECWKRRRTVPNCVNDSRRSPSFLRALPIHSVKCDGWPRKYSTVLKNLVSFPSYYFFYSDEHVIEIIALLYAIFIGYVYESSHIFSKSFVILSPWTVSEKKKRFTNFNFSFTIN